MKKISYSSLKNFSEIIQNEPKFRIQIVSLEPFYIFRDYLESNNIDFEVSLGEIKSSKKVIIILQPLKNSEDYKSRKIILYNKKINFDFIQIVFKPQKNEITKNLGLEKNFVNLYYDILSAHEMIVKYEHEKNPSNFLNLYNFSKTKILGNFLSKKEILVLFNVVSHSNLDEIVKNVKLSDYSLSNDSEILMILNDLVKNSYITKRGSIYKLNMPIDIISNICKEIGFDVNKIY